MRAGRGDGVVPRGTVRGLVLALGLAVWWSGPAAAQGADTAEEGDTLTVLELAEVVESALRTHPRLEAAGAGVTAAAAEAGEARAERLPTLGVTARGIRYEEPMVVAPLHGFDPRMPPEFDETLYQGHAAAEYTLFDGGARRSRIRAASSRVDAARAGAATARAEVVAEAVSAYLEALTARDVRAAHGELVAALESERARQALLLSEGTAPRVAVLRAEAALSEARASLEATAQRLDLALRRLARVSGLPVERVATAALAEVVPPPAVALDREALVARARAKNPRLAEARERAAAARSAAAGARAAYLPRVAATGRYSAYGSASTDAALEWQAGVEVVYPVFTGGARARRVERAAALAELAESESELAARSVADAVDAALVAYRSATARAEALEAAVAQSREVARIEALALESGAGVQSDFLRAQAALARARAGLAEARHAAIEARVRLAQAVGDLGADGTDWMEGVER
jgi:outer membrane protein TolC